MQTLNNVHHQFAAFFKSETLRPYAYLLSKKLSEGHICFHLNEVEEELEASGFYDSTSVKKTNRLQNEPLVTTAEGQKQPFVLHNQKLYFQRYFSYETQILQRIKAFVESEKKNGSSRMDAIRAQADFIRLLFDKAAARPSSIPIENINWQLVAAITGVLNDFSIITGGPGTGKTTTVAKILAILFAINPYLKVALAAPTGKAAVRMAESLHSASLEIPGAMQEKFKTINPGTIHRLLKHVPGSVYFRKGKDNPVNYDVVIVDESSMIDVALFAKLLNAIGPETKLILLGDKDQLASVEAGSLFGDLCKTQATFGISAERAGLVNALITDPSRQVSPGFVVAENKHLLFEHIVELKRSHRFSSDKGIGKFSKAIISNEVAILQEYLHKADDEQVTIDQEYTPEVFEAFLDGYKEYIREPDIRLALQKFNRQRVLCAVREGEQGLYKLNAAIETYLRKKHLLEKNTEFYENRPIIITRNYYALGLFNGDVGIVRPDENGVMKAWFEDSNKELKSVLPGFIAESDTVFAMTIHKSQGSEYDRIMVVMPTATNMAILTRELLYTGVTRARSKLIVQATEEMILHTAARVVKRASGILERFDE